MVATLSETSQEAGPAASGWQRLPPRMRILFITARPRDGGWLAEAFASDGASKVVVEDAVGTAAGLTRLRDETFDAVLVHHEPGQLDALDLVEGCRAGGAETPIVVVGTPSEQEMAVLCYEVGADGYACIHGATRNLIWVIGRAVQRCQLVSENQRLVLTEEARRQWEQDEAAYVCQQQRALLTDRGTGDVDLVARLPAELTSHYRHLLRAHVIMSAGNLADELKRLAELLVTAGLSARQTLAMHVAVLQELIDGLGRRSTRHVMTRADLLIVELLMHLADGYRRRYHDRTHPPGQRLLPGFDDPAGRLF